MATEGESREQVLAAAAGAGYVVSPTQLARWQQAGLIRRPRQAGLGRGRGTSTVYPPGTAMQLLALCHLKQTERRLGRLAFQLWWTGFDVDRGLIRAQLEAATEGSELDRVASKGTSLRRPQTPLEGVLRSSLGKDVFHDVLRLATGSTEPGPPTRNLAEILPAEEPPDLRSFATLVSEVVGALFAGTAPDRLIREASEAELDQARDRARALADSLQLVAGPVAWMLGPRRGAIYGLADRMLREIRPADLPGLVAAMVVIGRKASAADLEILDAPPEEPDWVRGLRLALEIRERVPGAAEVLTPTALRAMNRDGEAARNHLAAIEAFVRENEDEVRAIVTDFDDAWPRGSS